LGGRPANFLDLGGGSNAEITKRAVLFVAGDPDVKGILVNIFGGITRGAEVAKGIVMAQAELPKGMPIVARISGNGEQEARELLANAGLLWGADMRDAAQKIVMAVRARENQKTALNTAQNAGNVGASGGRPSASGGRPAGGPTPAAEQEK